MEGLAIIPVFDQSQPAEARRTAVRMAEALGFTETARGQIAIVVTEAATNLIKHGGGGQIIVRSDGRASGLEILAVDSGPGMSDVSACFRDGYSTAGSPGTGLGAISRMTTFTDVYTREGSGTILHFFCPSGKDTRNAQSDWDVASIISAKGGETVSGDGAGRIDTEDGLLAMVVDGLGHGFLAAEAAEAAKTAFEKQTTGARETVESIHAALRGTRGAALAVAEIRPSDGKVVFCGIGNISATVVNGEKAQHMVSMNGIAGSQSPRIRTFEYPWTSDSLLVMHSDGVSARWQMSNFPGLTARRSATIAAALLRDMGRGNDDATVLVAKMR